MNARRNAALREFLAARPKTKATKRLNTVTATLNDFASGAVNLAEAIADLWIAMRGR